MNGSRGGFARRLPALALAASMTLVMGSVLARRPWSGGPPEGGGRGPAPRTEAAARLVAGVPNLTFPLSATALEERASEGPAIWTVPGPALVGDAGGRAPDWTFAPDGLTGLSVVVDVGKARPRWVLTNAHTTIELLETLDVRLARADVVRPGRGSLLAHAKTVRVVRVRHELVTIAQQVPFPTITRYSHDLPMGAMKVLVKGTTGRLLRTFRVTYRDGREARRILLSQVLLRAPVARIIERAAAVVRTAAPTGAGATAAVEAAYSVLGVPYRWGGTSPATGFDCSGLTLWVWAKAGVSLPHSAAAQYSVTRRVPRSELRAGDLVFFYSSISHVGIYVGGGKMIHARRTGQPVQLSPLSGYWWSVYVGAGRPA